MLRDINRNNRLFMIGNFLFALAADIRPTQTQRYILGFAA